jgi:molybdopterin synthase sulfur carrier subunit
MIRVLLPAQLRSLAKVSREIEVQVEGTATLGLVLDKLEEDYPMLLGTLRDQVSKQRRPFIRFFAGGEDLSQEPTSNPLPEMVASGEETLRVVGAMSGG